MTIKELKQLLADKKISQETYDVLVKELENGKTISAEDIKKITSDIEAKLDEKEQLAKQSKIDADKVEFNKFMKEIANHEIIGETISDEEVKQMWEDNKRDAKKTAVEVINLWATREMEKNHTLGMGAKSFRANSKIGKQILDLQNKVFNALGINEISLSNLPSERILVDILVNDKTHEFYSNSLSKIINPFQYVEVGSGVNKTKELEIGLEEDDGSLIPSSQQVEATKPANFSFNVEFKLTDKKYKSYISTTDGDYVKYFKTNANLVAYIQSTIGKIKRALFLYQYHLAVVKYNEVFKELYAKATDGSTNHILCSKQNMLDACGEYKELKEAVKQFQSQKYTIESSNMTYAPSTSDKWVFLTPLKTKTNIEKFDWTALSGEANKKLMGDLDYIPDTHYNPLTKSVETLNVFTDNDGVIHNNCILAIEKDAFIPMYNLEVSTEASYPFGLTRVFLEFFRGNIELDKTCKCFLFEADALLQDFSIPTTTINLNDKPLAVERTEKAVKKGGKK